MAGFQVTPESFAPVAGQMRDVANQLIQAWQPVATQSQGVQFGRGDDIVSPLIQVSLQGAVALVNSSINSAAEALGSYADGLDAVGQLYLDTEQGTTSMLSPGSS